MKDRSDNPSHHVRTLYHGATLILAYTYNHEYTHTHAHTHTYIHTYIRTYTCTHIHMYIHTHTARVKVSITLSHIQKTLHKQIRSVRSYFNCVRLVAAIKTEPSCEMMDKADLYIITKANAHQPSRLNTDLLRDAQRWNRKTTHSTHGQDKNNYKTGIIFWYISEVMYWMSIFCPAFAIDCDLTSKWRLLRVDSHDNLSNLFLYHYYYS